MAIKDIFKLSRKTFFDPAGWLGYESVKDTTVTIWAILKGLFVSPTPERKETFAEAMQRLGLTEADVEKAETRYLLVAFFFLILGSLAFAVSFYYLLHHGTVSGFLLALATAAILFSQAFRYHFWYFQTKYRKLGCTFEEWRRGKPFDTAEPKQ